MDDERFKNVDDVIAALNEILSETDISDFTKSRFAGLVAVEAVCAFELIIRNIIFEFCRNDSELFGGFVQSRFKRLKGRIGISDLKTNFLSHFGVEYVSKFDGILEELRNSAFAIGEPDPTLRYDNILQNRHTFTHEGSISLTYEEVIVYYQDACKVIIALERTLDGS